MKVKTGIYRHFKGNWYNVFATGIDTVTDKEVILYQALYGNHTIFSRPIDDFCSLVPEGRENPTKQVHRFEREEDTGVCCSMLDCVNKQN